MVLFWSKIRTCLWNQNVFAWYENGGADQVRDSELRWEPSSGYKTSFCAKHVLTVSWQTADFTVLWWYWFWPLAQKPKMLFNASVQYLFAFISNVFLWGLKHKKNRPTLVSRVGWGRVHIVQGSLNRDSKRDCIKRKRGEKKKNLYGCAVVARRFLSQDQICTTIQCILPFTEDSCVFSEVNDQRMDTQW